MSEHDVERILGSPEKVIVNKVFCNWYYNDTSGAVNFNAESGKVEGWKEP